MTKERAPLTPYRALIRIADLIGYDGCADVLNLSISQIRKYSDQDTGREISFRDAIRLDMAFRAAGGEGAPLFEVYATRLEVERAPVTPETLLRSIRTAARESGQAVDAAIALASAEGRHDVAVRDVSEAIAAWIKTLLQLQGGKSSTS